MEVLKAFVSGDLGAVLIAVAESFLQLMMRRSPMTSFSHPRMVRLVGDAHTYALSRACLTPTWTAALAPLAGPRKHQELRQARSTTLSSHLLTRLRSAN